MFLKGIKKNKGEVSMGVIRRMKTKSSIEIKRYSKSIVLGGQTLYNGHEFTDANMDAIKKVINKAFEDGRASKAKEIRGVIGA